VAYGTYERKIWEETKAVFILDIARGQEAKGEQWETGRRVMRRIVEANREWAEGGRVSPSGEGGNETCD
jgi:hypothetical protein